MLWEFLTFLSLAGMAGVYWSGKSRLRRAQQVGQAAIEKLKEEQRVASTQLQTQQEALFNSMVEGLLVLDERGRILLANRAFRELFGVTVDIRSRTIIEAVRLHELAEVVEFLGTEKQVLGMELKISRPSERWLEINGAAIFDGAGRRQGTILVLHDLTRLKRLENTRKDFVANVSHELRTPLSLIQGYVETLLDGAKDNPEVASKFLHTIDRNAERLRLLIEDLLVISELESGRVRLDIQPMLVRPVVQKVLDDFKARAEAKEVELSNRSPDVTVRADPRRLEQVLGNLVDNAIKYGRAKGHVTVGGRAGEGGVVEVFVQDDGPGIAAEDLGRLFERFYRVDKARSREQGGTGLGLSIVKHIIQSHAGRVWARSEPGHGASFFFTLPQDGGERT
jgi:two-component system, OmpR family, phosphate regulon sensor histidine kinase PhoR